MNLVIVVTSPFDDQKPGTSGLRKKVTRFQEPHYLENFVQAIFNVVPDMQGASLVLGGDGRFYNDIAIQVIAKIAAANGVGKLIIGQSGILSTPAASNIIRKYGAVGGIILSASHNPGGPDGDFGIKFNAANGGPAPESLTEAMYENTKSMTDYQIAEMDDLDLSAVGISQQGGMDVQIIDPVADYAELMATLFDFKAIKTMFASGFSMCFDAMNAVTGPYATHIFEGLLGAPKGTVINAVPKPDFGGLHPDPNPVYAKALFDKMFSDDSPDFGAVSDGDGDRNIVLGRNTYVAPSDSLAMIVANATHIPAYATGLAGVARSMPTSCAVDKVAAKLEMPIFETPTGWKFFGNLLDDGRITICGEESAGTGGDHVREKDGLWAVLSWLNIIAASGKSVPEITQNHWQTFGRNYYTRHDYEGVDADAANSVMQGLEAKLGYFIGQSFGDETITNAHNFSYTDPVDGSVSANQGIVIVFETGSRIMFRKSGTGTVGATLRVYIEKYEADPAQLNNDIQTYLAGLIDAADTVSNLHALTGRNEPSVIS